MISNVQQKVSDAYRENPFWRHDRDDGPDYEKPEFLDFEEELIEELKEGGVADDSVLLDALEYLGWNKLVHAYEKLNA